MGRPPVTGPALSIVIPALDEAAIIPGLLADLRTLQLLHEIVVADGGSSDDTVRVALAAGAIVVHAEGGRGPQLRAGMRAATAPVLCVLHADVRLPPDTLRALEELARSPAAGAHAFTLRIQGRGIAYRVIELGAGLRARWLGLPYGDQGLVVDRATYDAVGGYADVPIMEDVLLVRALGARGGVRVRPERVLVSPRRWERDGAVRRTLANLGLMLRFIGGASPHVLASRYRPERSPGGSPVP